MFFTFLGYLTQFYGPMQFMSRVADFLSRSLASAERVFEVLDTESEIQDAAQPVPLPRIEGRVEFQHVTFGYDAHKPVLKDVSFDVSPGEMIGLVGQSGAGKSTTINLICRFYEVQEGRDPDRRRRHQADRAARPAIADRRRAAGAVPLCRLDRREHRVRQARRRRART